MFPFILALLGVAGIFFFASATQNHGWYLSRVVCQQGTVLCDNPSWLLMAAGALIVAEMVHSMAKS